MTIYKFFEMSVFQLKKSLLGFKKLANAKSGFTMIEALMSVLILSVSIMGMSLLTSLMAKSTTKINNKNSFDSMKYDLVSVVFTQQAWNNTINSASNTTLNCFKKNLDCRNQGGPVNGKLVLYDSSGQIFYNSTITTTGFTKTGSVCNGFDPDASDANCPVRFDVYWEPVCPPSGECLKPRIKVIGKSVANKSTIFTENSNSLLKNFEVIPLDDTSLPPVAVSDVYYVMRNSQMNGVDILANDKFPVGQTITVELVSANTDFGASVTLAADNHINVNYTTVPTFYGLDKFSYKIIREDGKFATASVWIKVMNEYTWTGDLSSSWIEPKNWCGSISSDFSKCNGHTALPSLTSVIYFDNTCSSSFTCSPTTSGSVVVDGIIITDNGFTQGSGSTITIGRAVPLGGSLPATLPVGWLMKGGVFNGSNSKITINNTAPFRIEKGVFNATSDILEFGRRHGNRASENTGIKILEVMADGNFVHNGGTVRVLGDADGSCSHKYWLIETAVDLTFNNLILDMFDTCWTSTGNGQLVSQSASGSSGRIRITSLLNHKRGVLKGDWYLSGNLTVETGAIGYLREYYGNNQFGKIIFNGSGDQTYRYGTAGATAFISIEKPTGRVLPDESTTNFSTVGLDIKSGEFVAPSGTLRLGTMADKTFRIVSLETTGNFTHNNGSVIFYADGSGGCGHKVFNLYSPFKNLDFFSVDINIHDTCWDSTGEAELIVLPGTNLTIKSLLTYNRGVLKGTWNLEGDLVVANTSHAVGYFRKGNSLLNEMATININGAADQFYEFGGLGKSPILVVDKPSGSFSSKAGNLLFNSTALRVRSGTFSAPSNGILQIGFSENLTLEILNVSAGATFNNNNSSLRITNPPFGACGYKNWTVSAPNVQFKDVVVQIVGTCTHGKLDIATGTYLNVTGDLTLNDGSINGEFRLAGNLNIGEGADIGSRASLVFVGDQNQTFSSASANVDILPTGEMKIEKVNGASLVLNSNINLSGTGQDLRLVSGQLKLNGKSLTVRDKLIISAGATLDASVAGSRFTPATGPNLENNGTIIPPPESLVTLGQ